MCDDFLNCIKENERNNTMIDRSKIKVGDAIDVRYTVNKIFPNGAIETTYSTVYKDGTSWLNILNTDEIVNHIPNERNNTMIDRSKIKVGDIIDIRYTVNRIFPNLETTYGPVFKNDEIVNHISKKIKVGDKVQSKSTGNLYEVLSIYITDKSNIYWVKSYYNNLFYSLEESEIELV